MRINNQVGAHYFAFLTTNLVAKPKPDEKYSLYNYQISFSSNKKRKQWRRAKCAVCQHQKCPLRTKSIQKQEHILQNVPKKT
jgi:hypothetical protein